MHKHTVAIIIPIYNPPNRWEYNCVEHIISVITLYPSYQFQFVFVNDGSEKFSFSKLRNILRKFKILYKLYSLRKNYGKGGALKIGAVKIEADHYICVDWDFPFGVAILGILLEKLEQHHDVVLIDRGRNYHNNLPAMRSIITQFWHIFITCFLHLNLNDTQGGLKGFNKNVRPYFLNCKTDSFLLDLEFIYQCKKHQVPIGVIVAELRPGIKFVNFPLRMYVHELVSFLHIFRDYIVHAKNWKKKRYIIVNADDFGMSKEVNEGIKQGIDAGVITSVSVMVNMPFFIDAVEFLQKHKEITVNLHFNITQNQPVLKHVKYNSLINANKEFFPLYDVLPRILLKKSNDQHIADELLAQFTKLAHTGLNIQGIDSHQHVHLIPKVHRLIMDLAKKNDISGIRGQRFHPHHALFTLQHLSSGKQCIILLGFIINALLSRSSTYRSDNLFDLDWEKKKNIQKFIDYLKNVPTGITEIICHPVITTNEITSSLLQSRQKTLKLLLNSRVQKILKSGDVQLVSNMR